MLFFAKATLCMRNTAIAAAFIGAVSGLVVSVWVHAAALAGIDPGGQIRGLWSMQLLLLVLILPLAADIFRSRTYTHILDVPGWMRAGVFCLLLYYGLNFYVFLYWSNDCLDSRATWRMFSAGWLLLFGVAIVYYWRRIALGNRLPDSADAAPVGL